MDIRNKIDDIKGGILQRGKEIVTGHHLTTGEKLINEMGLKQFEFIWFQRVISLSIDVFVITLDSRLPSTYFSMSKLKKLDSFKLYKGGQKGIGVNLSTFKLTPPVFLEDFNGDIGKRAVIIFNDIAGNYYMDRKMYESDGNRVEIVYASTRD